MTKEEMRKVEMLKAMDLLARSIKDEDIVMSWLAGGIEDDYIDYIDSMDDITACFLRCMKRAEKNGLYY